ncbi:MAG: biotin transporter BioY [Chloroflexi bacterium]|nr:biotin transporter BioY [Chloroflexota bacterium]
MTAASSRPSQRVLADLAVPIAPPGVRAAIRSSVLVGIAILVIAVSAQVSFLMPWSPVPYTLQTGAVLFVGVALGFRHALAATALYVALGVLGAPIFAAGASGMDRLLGATGGYLLGFVIAAALVGRLAEQRWDRKARSAAVLMVIGHAAIYVSGVVVLVAATGADIGTALYAGAIVFLPWDLFKVGVAAIALPLLWRTRTGAEA